MVTPETRAGRTRGIRGNWIWSWAHFTGTRHLYQRDPYSRLGATEAKQMTFDLLFDLMLEALGIVYGISHGSAAWFYIVFFLYAKYGIIALIAAHPASSRHVDSCMKTAVRMAKWPFPSCCHLEVVLKGWRRADS